jgi:RNA polymerase sigma factor (sigma-70 family)
MVPDKQVISPEDALMSQDLARRLAQVLAGLSGREREILRLRFGIGGEREHTLDEIGKRVSLTRERVRQIEAKTLRKLRDPLRDLRVLLEAA